MSAEGEVDGDVYSIEPTKAEEWSLEGGGLT